MEPALREDKKRKASPQLSKKQAKQQKQQSPARQINNSFIAAAKSKDARLALQTYDQAISQGISLPHNAYNILLFLCAGGENWNRRFQNLPIPWAADPRSKTRQQPEEGEPSQESEKIEEQPPQQTEEYFAEILRRGREISERLKAGPPEALNEMAFTGLARMAAAAGDGDEAFRVAREGQVARVPARLRTFLPALLAFVESGNLRSAFEVDEEIRSLGLDLTETEYAALLLACRHGSTREQADSVLSRLGRELTTLSHQTLAAAEAYFSSTAATADLPGGSSWRIERCTVSEDGVTSSCGGKVQAVDLEEGEWSGFSEAIAKLAAENEKKSDTFKAFQRWLEEHGPYKVILDGANLAFFGQNWTDGGFKFDQIAAALEATAKALPDQKALVILHKRRLKGELAEEEKAQQLIQKLEKENKIFATPYGSNDDWYWIYAAVKAGPDALLVSNDEMRDHIFQLLAPKFFLKWKQRHQMRYSFSGGKLQLRWPAKFTACTQKLSTGSWVLPAAESDEWLCATPTMTLHKP